MSVLSISFIPSKEQLYAGVPLSLIIETNSPSTIYYTLDGTTPTNQSPIYLNPIDMPSEDVVVVSALAMDGLGNYSTVFTQLFGPFYYKIDQGGEGLVVNSVDVAYADKFIEGYDVNDIAVVFLDMPPEDYFINKSATGFDGEGFGNIIPFKHADEQEEPNLIQNSFVEFSTPLNAQFFNPYAKNIIIDGSADNEVFILNRPNGSFRNDATYNYGKDYRIHGLGDNYISGGFTRHFYSEKNKKLVSYYNDTNSLRTIKSVQPYTQKPKAAGLQNFSSIPLVLPWIPRGRQQSI